MAGPSEGAKKAQTSGRMIGLTFDTGALIALERRRQRIAQVYLEAVREDLAVTVPSPVIVEWWRGRSAAREAILRGLRVERLDDELAKLAGEALAVVDASPVDAVVMASAARRGDIVYTSDLSDLGRLQRFFPNVRLLAV